MQIQLSAVRTQIAILTVEIVIKPNSGHIRAT